MAILVTGTPGVGKTTVSLELSRLTGKKYIDVADLARKKGFVKGFDSETQSAVVDTAQLRKFLENILTCNEIVDTHVVEAVPPGKVNRVLVLRLDPLELRKRLERRGYPAVKVKQNVESEILDSVLIDAIRYFGYGKVLEIDITGRKIPEIIETLNNILLRNDEKYRPGRIDWLKNYYYLLGQD
ncbi:MAG: adenylate kinase family protein [Thermofilum sp.]|jgi:adenylate kinase|nr:adenylate kinase family protein [Thermofilum sp.]